MSNNKKSYQTAIGQVASREIVEEMRESYLDYAMSVIVARALPDVRDGLKPVHRRILYAMHEDGLTHGAKYRKSATVVGSTLGRYHPHGDTAVYDSLVRMAQDFNMRYPLIDGQGNWGCFTKDTKVKVAGGRSLSFEDLIKEQKEGKRHWTFSFNTKERRVEIAEIREPRLTRKKAELVEVELDNGIKIRCTPDHRFLARSGIYREAKSLKQGTSLMPAYFNVNQVKTKKGKHLPYLSILQPFTGKYEMVHKLADLYNERNNLVRMAKMGSILHHKDFNRWNNSPDNIIRLAWEEHQDVHKKQAKKAWEQGGIELKRKHRAALQRAFADPAVRMRMAIRSRQNWEDPEYREKYAPDHQAKMAKRLWEKAGMREFHREKIQKQRQQPSFCARQQEGVVASNKRRIEADPDFMRKLTQLASASLQEKWQTSAYKERVIKSKILGFASRLLTEKNLLTPEAYDRARTNNGIPKAENAAQYFDGFKNMVEEAKTYNHKVVRVRSLRKKEDVYDITVGPWHNFLLDAEIFVHNSVDGDPPAAQRYTEARMSRIGEFLLQDIGKGTVDFVENYDGTRKEPTVLPSPVPQLLLNGTLGIAVGMATNIPPHNIKELLDALMFLLENSKATSEDLFQFVKGPDFPTGGTIFNKQEIIAAYSQGKGPVVMRGRAEIQEQEGKKHQIVITEIPFQVSKASLVEQFAKLVQEKKIEGVRDIRDESDKEGLRIVFDLQRDAYPQKILNRLYKFSDFQKTFHLNMLALVDGIQPKVLSLAEILNEFLEHKRKVVTRRTAYDLARAKERAHILEGLQKCLTNIDRVIKLIKSAQDREDAKIKLQKAFRLSELQANAILDMRLAQLARLERKKIEDELKAVREKIKELASILASPKKINALMKKEFAEARDMFGDERKTRVVSHAVGEIAEEDLVPQEETIITLTQGGYIKRINPSTYKLQKRGGKGIVGMKTVGEDIIEHFLYCNTHDSLMVFTDSGKAFQLPVYEIPEGTRVAKGRGLLNFVDLTPKDKVLNLFALAKSAEGGSASGGKDAEQGIKYMVMITKNGILKKTPLEDFRNVRKSGLIAISLKKGDELRVVRKSAGQDQIIVTTKKGQSIRFKEKDVRSMGRTAAGIHAMRLKKGPARRSLGEGGDEVVGMDVISENQKSNLKNQNESDFLLILTENGYGKRTHLKEYRVQTRGGSGIKTANITAKTGNLVYAKVLSGEEEDLIVISQKGQIIRTPISDIPKISRATQGVRIMRLEQGDPSTGSGQDKIASAASF